MAEIVERAVAGAEALPLWEELLPGPAMKLGARPRIRRGRAHGACAASARREEEAMSVHIINDEQRGERRATPMRPSGSGGAGASAALALLDEVHRDRLRRAA